MTLLLSVLVMIAVYLAWGPLPVIRMPELVIKAQAQVSQLAKSLHKPKSPSPIAFLWTLHSEVMAGSLIDSALLKASDCLPAKCFENTHAALQDNGDVAAALEVDARNVHLGVLSDVALVYRITRRTGAPITDSLMRIITSVRDAQRRQRTLAQETASTKATVVVLAALPGLGCLMGFGLGLNPLSWFLHSALGAVCCLSGIILEIFGWLWVRILVRRATWVG